MKWMRRLLWSLGGLLLLWAAAWLALQRGLAVRDTLIAKGLASERLFLGDPKLRAGAAGDPPWTPQVKLSLDTQ